MAEERPPDDRSEQQDLQGGALRKSALNMKLERARHALQDALGEAHGWYQSERNDLGLLAVHEVAGSLKKIRKLESDIAGDNP